MRCFVFVRHAETGQGITLHLELSWPKRTGTAGRAAAAEAGEVAVDEPLAEWETELLAGSNDAATPEVAPAQAAAE